MSYIFKLSKSHDQNVLDILFSTYLNFMDTKTLLGYISTNEEYLNYFLKNYLPYGCSGMKEILEKNNISYVKEYLYHDTKKVLKSDDYFKPIFSDEFLKIPDFEITLQITLLAQNYILKITKQDLIFSSEAFSKNINIPSINEYISFNNKIELWVCNMIVLTKNVAKRALIFSKFINIMDHLKKLHNYDSMFWIKEGLLNSSVKRLKLTKSIIEKSQLLKLESIEKLTSNMFEFINEFSKLTPPFLPCVYFIMCMLRGYSESISFENGWYPWKKAKLLYSKSQSIYNEKFLLKQNDKVMNSIRFYLSLKMINYNELYLWSLYREPKDDEEMDSSNLEKLNEFLLGTEYEQEEWIYHYITQSRMY